MRSRLAISCMFGLAAAALCYVELVHRNQLAADYTWVWRGAHDLLAGRNPYQNPDIGIGHPYPWNALLFYPLPAVFAAIPTVWLPALWAGVVFIGVSFAGLAFALLGKDSWRLMMLLSAPAFCAIRSAQWSPLLIALSLVPALASIAPILKPNLGIPLFIMSGQKKRVVAGVVVLIASLIVLPSWPLGWLHSLGTNTSRIPLAIFPLGPVMLIALVAWRRPVAWTFLLFALMPQRLVWYDQLPLLMLPKTWRQSSLVFVTSWLGFIGWNLTGAVQKVHMLDDTVAPWVLASVYLPLLLVVLWECRPSEAETTIPGLSRGLVRLRTRLNVLP